MKLLWDEIGRYSAIGSMGSPGGVTFARVYDRLRCEELALCTTKRPKDLGTESALNFARLSRLDHPVLTRVRDFGLTDEAAFYSREVGLPSTLKDLATDSIEESWIYSCLIGAAEGLAALHASGLVHGLVLPEHLHVATENETLSAIRIADAGLRQLLAPAALRTRERYDPPEVRAGAEITPATDIYQLGTTLLNALGRSGWVPAAALGELPSSISTARGRSIDRQLLDLLNGLVAPDPRKRYANGQALRRAVQGADWAMPERSVDMRSLVTPQLVGRENALGRFGAFLERAAAGDVHAVEFVGPSGMGRSRMLRECGVKAEQEGWIVIPIAPEDRTATIVAAAARGNGKLLFLVDNADRSDPDLISALRILITDAARRPLLVVSTGERAVGLPGPEPIVLERFSSRDLERFIEPLLLRALNPEDVRREVERSAAGNPLWVELILVSWLESGRLRLVHGRPFLDERIAAPVPVTIAETISFIVQGLTPGERDLVEAMAVWDAPLATEMAERVLSRPVQAPPALVSTDSGRYRFLGETVGRVILGALAKAQKEHWSTVFLSALAADELQGDQRASLLLGAGRIGEAIRTLVAEGREAEGRNAYPSAFRHFRDALAHHPAAAVPGFDRVRLTLDAVRLATMIGELHWAREVLENLAPIELDPDRAFERVFLQAKVLLKLRHFAEATERFTEARALIQGNPRLQERLVEVELEEAANDAGRGEGERALRGVEVIVERLESNGASAQLGLAWQRLGLLHAHLGHTRAAAVAELRCARVARRIRDHQLAARAYVNLGSLYRLLHQRRRALLAVDSAQAELAHCPHDGLAASALVNRAETLIEIGRTEEAEAALLRARALRQRTGERARLPVVLIDLAALCRHGGRLAAAAAYLREAILIAEEFELPVAKVAQSNLGEIFLHQGEYEEAGRLLRLGLAHPRPHNRALVLINLGRLYRERLQLREALQFLDEAETLLRDSAPHYRPLAVIERGRVLLDAGDVDGATLQLLQVESDIGESGEQQAEYGLLAGLITAARGEAPQPAFDAAIDAVRGSSDPTLRAEILIAVLERAIAHAGIDRDWIAGHLPMLESAAAKTDARPVAIGVRLIRGAFAERFPSSPGSGTQIRASLERNLERGESGLETALSELLHGLPGAIGAAVFMVGIDADGKPLVTSIPRAEAPPEPSRRGCVRPYRLAVREFDRKVFREALAAANGNVHEAARQLRLPTSTFRYRAIKLGLLKPTQRDR